MTDEHMKRHSIRVNPDHTAVMVEDPNGEWIHHEAVENARQVIGKLEDGIIKARLAKEEWKRQRDDAVKLLQEMKDTVDAAKT